MAHDLTKHIAPHANGKPLLKQSSSHSPSVLQRLCLSSGLPKATVVLLSTGSSKVNYLPMEVSGRNCGDHVSHQTNIEGAH